MAAHGAEDLVGDGAAPGRVVVGGDAGAEEGDFVAYLRERGVVGYVDCGQVHADATEDGGSLVVDDDPTLAEAGGRLAPEAVRVANGRRAVRKGVEAVKVAP